MAEWKQTLEPYVKVQERVKTVALNPTAGEDLIIGVALISDAGPSTPTLISGQSEFLATYASQDMSQAYLESLNQLYKGADKTTAATMWANAYRLAGSNTMLCVRASKADGVYFAKPLVKGDNSTYILRDGELLKKVEKFKLVLDIDKDDADHDQNGWSININGVGIFGNRTTDDGAQYDYFVRTLPDLVELLNDTTKFFSPAFRYFEDAKGENEIIVDMDDEVAKGKVMSVIFDEAYLGHEILDKSDSRCDGGLQYVISCEPDWTPDNPDQKVIDLNASAWSGFSGAKFYATNVYNSASNLKVRIRRFNHDAVISKTITDTASLNENSNSPYTVLTSVLDTFTKKGTVEPSADILARDFYEVAVFDPSINSEVSFFNIGNILGRGDIEVSELNSMVNMIQVELPDDMHELGLNYFGYDKDDKVWIEYVFKEGDVVAKEVASYSDLAAETEMQLGDIYLVTSTNRYYKYSVNGASQVFADLTIDPLEYEILSVSDADLKKALDKIALDEVYVTEGLCDLGNTELSYQSYMANMAINDNYFYPISTVNSTNYMTIANSISKISQDSRKLYANSPWDIDTGTLGWKYYASPAVLYWESVARNRRNNEEFASILGQKYGIMQYQRPTCEFGNRKIRQLLLSKRVNTNHWNVSTQAWNMNDCYTKQNENTIMSEDGNARLEIRISKAMPVLLRQFIGKKISEKLCADVISVIDYWFKTSIMSMGVTIEAYNIICNYDPILARQNKIKVLVQVRYMRSLKFIDVFNDAYDVGMEFEEE